MRGLFKTKKTTVISRRGQKKRPLQAEDVKKYNLYDQHSPDTKTHSIRHTNSFRCTKGTVKQSVISLLGTSKMPAESYRICRIKGLSLSISGEIFTQQPKMLVARVTFAYF